MPLVWAHAEYVKLVRSLDDGRVFDTPPQTVKRYIERNSPSPFATWRFNNKARAIPRGKKLRIETAAASVVHWSSDEWQSNQNVSSFDTTIGMWVTDLATDLLPAGAKVQFTIYWPDSRRWEDADFSVSIGESP